MKQQTQQTQPSFWIQSSRSKRSSLNFDGEAYLFDKYRKQAAHLDSVTDSTLQKLFYENKAWLICDRHYTRTMTQLYIFADKYSVYQLSDDIISAMMGFNVAWSAYPDPEVPLINLAYANLPRTAPLICYIVLSVVYYWVTDLKTHSVEEIEKLPPQYLVDVMVAQAQRQNSRRELVAEHPQCETLPDMPMDCFTDSCAFHEHLVYDRAACRQRLANAHIFTGLIEACMKEAEKLSTGIA
jgi:hypothetical protein